MSMIPPPAEKPVLTPIDDALHDILGALSAVAATEIVPLSRALHRLLVGKVTATIDVPGNDNSAMDGYAVDSRALASGQRGFSVSQRIPAGYVGAALTTGTVARIFTGAPIPEGADAVVMQENCEEIAGNNGKEIVILQPVTSGENVRRAGADIRAGTVLFEKGHRLRAPDIGMLAGIGLESVEVRRPLRVALLTTGDELVKPGQPLQKGQIYNSNFYTISALLQGLGHEVIDCGIVADTLQATEQMLLQAAGSSDCIISSGGVSVGEEDHVRIALENMGNLAMWKLAIKPGKPFAYGSVAGKPFFGLPGNPVSTFVNFVLIVRPCLELLSGGVARVTPMWRLAADFTAPKSGLRQEYLRVRCYSYPNGDPHGYPDGESVLQLAGSQSSGVLSSVSNSDGLAIVPPFTAVAKGDRLRFIPLSEIVGHV